MSRYLIIILTALLGSQAMAHSVGEAAGLRFVYGSTPEPAITDELLNMQWIVRDLETGEPAGNLTDMSVELSLDGQSWGPFEPEAAFGEPGLYSTAHLFAKPGTYEATLSFKREGSDELQTITLEAHVIDRADLVIE